jgi:hypothetical protein
MFTCAISAQLEELQQFREGQIFLLGKKRTMFQLVHCSETQELRNIEQSDEIEEYAPIQVKLSEMQNFREYQVLAATARYLFVRGRIVAERTEYVADFFGLNRKCIMPDFWIERVRVLLGEQ